MHTLYILYIPKSQGYIPYIKSLAVLDHCPHSKGMKMLQ